MSYLFIYLLSECNYKNNIFKHFNTSLNELKTRKDLKVEYL